MNVAASSTPRAARWWRSYSLRTLLVVITLLGIALGLQVRSAQRQQRAVQAIRDFGGSVAYDFQFNERGDFDPQAAPPVPAWLVDWLGDDFFCRAVEVNLAVRIYGDREGAAPRDRFNSDAALTHVGRLPHVRKLVLKQSQVRDESLPHIGRLKKLEMLSMWNAAEVSDAGMRHLQGLEHLKRIDVYNTQMTDESLRMFGAMPSLEVLRLEGHRFTDQGLAHLKDLPNLTTLWIRSPKSEITDEGLLHLHAMKSLESIGLQDLPVTIEGVDKLQAALPDAKILYNRPK